MKIDEFVKEYNEMRDKVKYVEKHILSDVYVPYYEKITRCKNLLNATMFVDVKNVKTFRQNSPAQYMLYSLELINLYTDIDIEFGDDKVVDSFDSLDRYGLINILLASIPAFEFDRWNNILQMMLDDINANSRDIVSFLETKMTSGNIFMNNIVELLENVASVEKENTYE